MRHLQQINPNGKIPAIVDTDAGGEQPLAVFESGAILIYLAEKFDSPLLPKDVAGRSRAIQWLMFQMSAVGPMFGQAGYFARFAPEPVPAAIERYTNEAHRILSVLEGRLSESAYLAGPDYTIADIATWPWIMGTSNIGLDLAPYPAVSAWAQEIGERPAVQRAMLIGAASLSPHPKRNSK